MKHYFFCTSAIAAALALAGHTSAQPIQTWIEFPLSPTYDAAGAVDQDAGDESLDALGAISAIYGDITGNTISRSDFTAAVAAAYAAGRGGVLTFDNPTLSGVDFVHPTAGTINRFGGAALKIGNMMVERGPNWYFEGSLNGVPYRGRDTAAFDGTGPSGPDRANFDEVFFIRNEANGTLGQTTSWDLDFDPADMVTTIGWTMLNYNNFQSSSSVAAGAFPSVHGRATFTNGVDSVVHMAVAIPEQADDGFDHYFGFQAPPGYFLDRIEAYQIGNNSRAFPGLDDLGFVRIPEPGAALLAVLGAAFAGITRRRTS
jgi:hypothetical protein